MLLSRLTSAQSTLSINDTSVLKFERNKIINKSFGVDPSGVEQEGLDYWLKGSAAGAQGAGEAGKSSLAGKLEMWLSADE